MTLNDIVNQLITYNWNGSSRIEDLIVNMCYHSINDPCLKDKIIDDYADTKTRSYSKLVQHIKKVNETNTLFQKLILEERIDGDYLEKRSTHPHHSEKYLEVITLINNFERKKNKGIIYEKFCENFLEDLGISSRSTPKSNDKGIDILGSFNVKLSEEIGDLVFNEEIYLLIQTKYFNKKIDTPVIRKLVGDSLFIRFDDLDYINIKHNAFHLIVFSHLGFTEPAIEFAKRNKIKLFDSTKIAHIISEKPNKQWNCLNFID